MIGNYIIYFILKCKFIKLIDLSFDFFPQFTAPAEVLNRWEGYGYAAFIKEQLSITIIEHINYEGTALVNGVGYSFFKSHKKFWHIPFKTLRYIKNEKPDIIISQGLIFPLQVIALRFFVGKNIVIMVQHHGERPFTGIKKYCQKIADHYINAYLFTAMTNASEWLQNKIIRKESKCHEILEASTFFAKQDKQFSKIKTGISGDYNFLWVGRLNANKDPLTVLTAFEKYLAVNAAAKLYMIYQETDLPAAVKNKINENDLLQKAVVLQGKVRHEELAYWFSSADFYISASRKEGSGYALIEAMACGCIPLLTDIPSFRAITSNGKFGFLYEAGNAAQLFVLLCNLNNINREKISDSILQYFSKELSFKAIAGKIFALSRELINNHQGGFKL